MGEGLVGKQQSNRTADTEEIAKLLVTGKLNVSLDKKGQIIPETEDIKNADIAFPDAPPGLKFRIAQAHTLLRAKVEYDEVVAAHIDLHELD
jgi:hypothetical protein